jgi:hypothetical protein
LAGKDAQIDDLIRDGRGQNHGAECDLALNKMNDEVQKLQSLGLSGNFSGLAPVVSAPGTFRRVARAGTHVTDFFGCGPSLGETRSHIEIVTATLMASIGDQKPVALPPPQYVRRVLPTEVTLLVLTAIEAVLGFRVLFSYAFIELLWKSRQPPV